MYGKACIFCPRLKLDYQLNLVKPCAESFHALSSLLEIHDAGIRYCSVRDADTKIARVSAILKPVGNEALRKFA